MPKCYYPHVLKDMNREDYHFTRYELTLVEPKMSPQGETRQSSCALIRSYYSAAVCCEMCMHVVLYHQMFLFMFAPVKDQLNDIIARLLSSSHLHHVFYFMSMCISSNLHLYDKAHCTCVYVVCTVGVPGSVQSCTLLREHCLPGGVQSCTLLREHCERAATAVILQHGYETARQYRPHHGVYNNKRKIATAVGATDDDRFRALPGYSIFKDFIMERLNMDGKRMHYTARSFGNILYVLFIKSLDLCTGSTT